MAIFWLCKKRNPDYCNQFKTILKTVGIYAWILVHLIRNIFLTNVDVWSQSFYDFIKTLDIKSSAQVVCEESLTGTSCPATGMIKKPTSKITPITQLQHGYLCQVFLGLRQVGDGVSPSPRPESTKREHPWGCCE